jgi:hypothetical protein
VFASLRNRYWTVKRWQTSVMFAALRNATPERPALYFTILGELSAQYHGNVARILQDLKVFWGICLPHYELLPNCQLRNARVICRITMVGLQFQDRLKREFGDRRKTNPRYSLRAFAAFLGGDHSTVSQVLRGERSVPLRQLRSWAKKLGIPCEEVAAYVAALHVPDRSITKRQEQLRHWTSEALAIMNDRSHWQIVRLSQTARFRPDCRWVAEETGVSVDEVNLALSRLLRLRLLKIGSSGHWEVLNCGHISEPEFRKLALIRVRQQAAEYGVEPLSFRRKAATEGEI